MTVSENVSDMVCEMRFKMNPVTCGGVKLLTKVAGVSYRLGSPATMGTSALPCMSVMALIVMRMKQWVAEWQIATPATPSFKTFRSLLLITMSMSWPLLDDDDALTSVYDSDPAWNDALNVIAEATTDDALTVSENESVSVPVFMFIVTKDTKAGRVVSATTVVACNALADATTLLLAMSLVPYDCTVI